MSLPQTYQEVAEKLRVNLCNRRCQEYALEQHTRGYTDATTVHWKPRIVVRRGLWNFLKLVAQVKLGSLALPTAERIWLENVTAVDLGENIGVRFPRSFAHEDRSRVRAALAAHPGSVGPDLRDAIIRWSYDD
ncbi:MAG TPA: hypothetical protein VFX15_03090 [Actinomycetes bacterium]|nr:hypothetical protein [Actinomycetes bacterium]